MTSDVGLLRRHLAGLSQGLWCMKLTTASSADHSMAMLTAGYASLTGIPCTMKGAALRILKAVKGAFMSRMAWRKKHGRQVNITDIKP